MNKNDIKNLIKDMIKENYSPLDTWGQKALVSLNQLISKNENSNFLDLLTQIKNEFSLENDELFKVAINSTYPIVDEDDLKSQIWDLQEEKVKPDYGTQLKMAADKAKREKNVEAMAYYQLLQNTSASVPFEKFKGSWAYDQWKDKPEVQKAIADIQAHFKSHPWLEENNDCNCGAQNKAEHDPHKDSCNVNKNTCKKCKKGEYRHQSYGKHGGFYACDYCGNELRESSEGEKKIGDYSTDELKKALAKLNAAYVIPGTSRDRGMYDNQHNFKIVKAIKNELKKRGELDNDIDDEDVCGYCGQGDTDKVAAPIGWPNQVRPNTKYVHADCEDEAAQSAMELYRQQHGESGIDNFLKSISEGSGLYERTPPRFPKDLKAKIKAQYKDNPKKAFSTMWSIYKKAGNSGKVEEAWYNIKKGIVNEDDSHKICAHCQKEFDITPENNASHGICKRHFIAMAKGMGISDDKLNQSLQKYGEDKFCDDMSLMKEDFSNYFSNFIMKFKDSPTFDEALKVVERNANPETYDIGYSDKSVSFFNQQAYASVQKALLRSDIKKVDDEGGYFFKMKHDSPSKTSVNSHPTKSIESNPNITIEVYGQDKNKVTQDANQLVTRDGWVIDGNVFKDERTYDTGGGWGETRHVYRIKLFKKL